MLVLVLIGILAGLTTVLFGFGGGFVTVPVIVWADGALGAAAPAVAVATSAVVMVVNAAAATAATSRATLAHLRSAVPLVALLGCGGALGAGLARLSATAADHLGFRRLPGDHDRRCTAAARISAPSRRDRRPPTRVRDPCGSGHPHRCDSLVSGRRRQRDDGSIAASRRSAHECGYHTCESVDIGHQRAGPGGLSDEHRGGGR